MEKSKHTAGPWSATDTCSDYSFVVVRRGQGFPDFNVGNEADARLIAAAPELLEALQQLAEAADTSDDCQYGTLSTSFVRDIARAAIAKATGEE